MTAPNVSDKQGRTLSGSERLSEPLRPHGLDRLAARADIRFDPPRPEAQRGQHKSAVLRLKRERRDYLSCRGR